MKSIIFQGVNPNDFSSELKEYIDRKFHELETKLSSKPNLLNRKQTCDLLDVSPSTLFHWNKKGILKPKNISGRVYYLYSDIEKALEKFSSK